MNYVRKMLPSDIFTIIDKYNEEGIVLLIGDSFYWFNGKQIKFFVKAPKGIDRFLWYEGRLYFINQNGIQNILKMNEFVKFNSLHNYCFYNYDVDKNNRIYINASHIKELGHCHTDIIRFNGSNWEKIVKKDDDDHGKQFLIYKEIIYYFSFIFNEKFDIVKNEWSPFANPEFKFHKMYLFRDKFYDINAKRQIVYDPIMDQWSCSVPIISSVNK